MVRKNVVTLRLDERRIEELKELDFGKLISDIELLAQQPLVDVDPYYINKKKL